MTQNFKKYEREFFILLESANINNDKKLFNGLLDLLMPRILEEAYPFYMNFTFLEKISSQWQMDYLSRISDEFETNRSSFLESVYRVIIRPELYGQEVKDYLSSMVGDEYDKIMSAAIRYGDVDTIKLFAQAHDYKPVGKVDIQALKEEAGSFSLWKGLIGQPTRELLDIIHRLDADYLLQAEIEMRCTKSKSFSEILSEFDLQDKSFFSGGMPTVFNGVVSHPELAISFREQVAFNKHLFSRIPVWVHRDSIDFFENASLFEWVDDRFYSDDMNQGGAPIAVERGWRIEGGEGASLADCALAQSLIPKEILIGKGIDTKKYSLMVVDVDELLSIPIASVSSSLMKEAEDYASTFADIEYYFHAISNIPSAGETRTIGLPRTDSKNTVFFHIVDSAELFDCLSEIYPDPDFWISQLNYLQDVHPTVLKKVFEVFPTLPKSLASVSNYTESDLELLHESGFKFDEDQRVMIHPALGSASAIKVIQMGGWPYSSSKPDLAEAIKTFTRSKDSKVADKERNLIAGSDPRKVLAACKTGPQFDAVIPLLSGERNYYYDLLPSKHKSKSLSSDLGL